MNCHAAIMTASRQNAKRERARKRRVEKQQSTSAAFHAHHKSFEHAVSGRFGSDPRGKLSHDELKALLMGGAFSSIPGCPTPSDFDVDLILRVGGDDLGAHGGMNVAHLAESLAILTVLQSDRAMIANTMQRFDWDSSGQLSSTQLKALLQDTEMTEFPDDTDYTVSDEMVARITRQAANEDGQVSPPWLIL